MLICVAATAGLEGRLSIPVLSLPDNKKKNLGERRMSAINFMTLATVVAGMLAVMAPSVERARMRRSRPR